MSNNLLQQIKQIKISSIISNYLQINKKGRNYFAICPFHNDKNPSLVISDEKNIFKCFTCNVSGDSISFVKKFKNLNDREAIKEIAINNNLDSNLINDFDKTFIKNNPYLKNYNLNEDYYELCKTYLYQTKNNEYLNYLYNRHISDEDINYFKIGYNPDENNSQIYDILTSNSNNIIVNNRNTYSRDLLIENGLITINNNGTISDFFKNRIIFSICDENNNIVGFSGRSLSSNTNISKYQNSPQTKIFNKNAILYNYNNVLKLKDYWSLYIVEGFMDAIALHKSDIKNVVATMGVSLSQHHIDLLMNNKKIESIILCFDNDQAGKMANIKNGLLLNKYFDTYVVKSFDSKFKDMSDIYNFGNKELVNKYANNIVHFSVYYLENLLINSSFQNEVDINHIYLKALSFLKFNAKKQYIKNYCEIINKYLNIDINKINNDLTSNNFIKVKQIRKHNGKSINEINFSRSLLINQFILACVHNNKIPSIIQNKYLNLKELDPLLYETINIFIEFYNDHPHITNINESNLNELKEYINKYSSKQDLYETIYSTMNNKLNKMVNYSDDLKKIEQQINVDRLNAIKYKINILRNKIINDDNIKGNIITKEIDDYLNELNYWVKLMNNYNKKNN